MMNCVKEEERKRKTMGRKEAKMKRRGIRRRTKHNPMFRDISHMKLTKTITYFYYFIGNTLRVEPYLLSLLTLEKEHGHGT